MEGNNTFVHVNDIIITPNDVRETTQNTNNVNVERVERNGA